MNQYDEAAPAAEFVGKEPLEAVVSASLPVRKQSPQAGVDRFWKRFTTKYPGKVTSILPSNAYAKTKAAKSPKGLVSSQSAGKSYDQACLECKNAVLKIAKECTKINAKYRDPHFDIEFDLKRGRRNCLDGLEELDEDAYAQPGSVKRVPDVFEKPEFYQDEATASDVRQGRIGDCWFLAAVCAISNKKNLIDKICVAREEKVGVYGFVFHRDGEWIHTIVDDKLYLLASDWWETLDQDKRLTSAINGEAAEERYRKSNQTGSKALYFAQCRSENETWLPLLEKAYAKAHGDYSAIDGGFTGEGIEDLTGGVTCELFTTDILDKDKFWEELLTVNEEFLFGCTTGTFDKWQGSDTASKTGARSGVIRMHAYSIMDAVEKKGKRLVKVRNPWATDEWRGAWSDGSEQWTAEWLTILDHKFGDDGMFWISYEDLLQKYSNFERTRLFGDEWSVVQQWTTVNVPWSADYNETKFEIELKQSGPVVIVLSQLDDRYFKGMTGRYMFKLHFRVDKDDSEDYIVRSQENYSTLRRSVSADVELEAGKYSVLMRITATRYDDETPEAVIRKMVLSRPEKLIQVGMAYDLAHAKGEIRETEEEKKERRLKEEKGKAEAKKKQREAVRAQKKIEWERGRRQRARNKRHEKRKMEYQRKKAEQQKATDAAEPVVKNGVENGVKNDVENGVANVVENGIVNGTSVAAGVETEVDKQAAAANGSELPGGAVVSVPDINVQAAESEPTIDAEPAKGADPVEQPSVEDVAAPAAPEEGAEPPIQEPSEVLDANGTKETVNTTDDTNEAPANDASAVDNNADTGIIESTKNEGTLAPPAFEDDDDDDDDAYQYSDAASFVSSIDSVLDFPDNDTTDEGDPAAAAPVTNDPAAAEEDEDDDGDDGADTEFIADPWNAVCVVGLRVYSKDPACKIEAVRPKPTESVLDVDDGNKGASGEVEESEKIDHAGGNPSAEPELKVGV